MLIWIFGKFGMMVLSEFRWLLTVQWRALVNTLMNVWVQLIVGNFLIVLSDFQLKDRLYCIKLAINLHENAVLNTVTGTEVHYVNAWLPCNINIIEISLLFGA
jgi:hypothetical protein